MIERVVFMELTELLDQLKVLFGVENTKELTNKLKTVSVNNQFEYHQKFTDIVSDLKIDWLQKVYQYYEADREGKKQDYTPKSIGVLLSKLLGKCNKVYDQCAGSGSLTIQYWSYYPDTEFICEELDENVIPYLLFNLSLRNIRGYVVQKDILSDETYCCYKLKKGNDFSTITVVDRIDVDYERIDGAISNPPYNIKWKHPEFASFDSRFQYGIPPESNANYAFVLNAISKAKKSAYILPNSVLTTSNKSECEVVKELVNHNLLDTVITLPDKMFEATSIPTSILLLDNNRTVNKVHMVDMRKECVEDVREQKGQYGGTSHTSRMYKKTINVFSDENIKRCIEVISQKASVSGFYKYVSIETIKNENYMLTPSRYIIVEKEYTHRDLKNIVNDINENIRDKNVTKITINESLAKAMGLYGVYEMQERGNKIMTDWNEELKSFGIQIDKESCLSVSKKKNEIKIEQQDKEIASELIMQIINSWKAHIMYLNNKQNILLAELRDALLSDLMSGKIQL